MSDYTVSDDIFYGLNGNYCLAGTFNSHDYWEIEAGGSYIFWTDDVCGMAYSGWVLGGTLSTSASGDYDLGTGATPATGSVLDCGMIEMCTISTYSCSTSSSSSSSDANFSSSSSSSSESSSSSSFSSSSSADVGTAGYTITNDTSYGCNGNYCPEGVYNGHTYWENAGGTRYIFWTDDFMINGNAGWVVFNSLDDTAIGYYGGGTGATPSTGTWNDEMFMETCTVSTYSCSTSSSSSSSSGAAASSSSSSSTSSSNSSSSSSSATSISSSSSSSSSFSSSSSSFSSSSSSFSSSSFSSSSSSWTSGTTGYVITGDLDYGTNGTYCQEGEYNEHTYWEKTVGGYYIYWTDDTTQNSAPGWVVFNSLVSNGVGNYAGGTGITPSTGYWPDNELFMGSISVSETSCSLSSSSSSSISSFSSSSISSSFSSSSSSFSSSSSSFSSSSFSSSSFSSSSSSFSSSSSSFSSSSSSFSSSSSSSIDWQGCALYASRDVAVYAATEIDVSRDIRVFNVTYSALSRDIRVFQASPLDISRDVRVFSGSGSGTDAGLISRHHFTHYGVDVYVDGTWKGFIDLEEGETTLTGVAIADGDHTITFEMSRWFWTGAKKTQSFLISVSGGSATIVTALPEVIGLAYEYALGYVRLTWTIEIDESLSGSDTDGFGAWIGAVSPVATTGSPDYHVSYNEYSRRYAITYASSTSHYARVAAYAGDARGTSQEVYVSISSTVPDSPDGQTIFEI